MTNKPDDAAGQKVQHFYREAGTGHPLLFLHGGWGYGTYPFDRQIHEFGREFRIVIPDRYGYGKSGCSGKFPKELPAAEIHFIEGAGHSPHSEPSAFSITSQLVHHFLTRIGVYAW